jgi:hypothetical protein
MGNRSQGSELSNAAHSREDPNWAGPFPPVPIQTSGAAGLDFQTWEGKSLNDAH